MYVLKVSTRYDGYARLVLDNSIIAKKYNITLHYHIYFGIRC